MIRSSFIFLDNLGSRREQNLWHEGIDSWDDFLNQEDIPGIGSKRRSHYARKIKEAQHALYSFDSEYFFDKLPSTETWRLYDFFKEDAVFLDIETSGVNGHITVIGLYDGINTKVMVKDVNLDLHALKDELKKYKLLVTFNGSVFDVPFLEKRYPGLIPKIPHFDLRFLCSSLGWSGGLKQIERQFGIERKKIIEKLYGGDAISLYRMFRATGDRYYLDLLIEYNEDDCINLKKIADEAVEQKLLFLASS